MKYDRIFSSIKSTTISERIQVEYGSMYSPKGDGFCIQVFNSEDGETAGNWTFEYECSIDGVNFVTPTGVEPIKESHKYNSGPNIDGHDIYQFTTVPCTYMKLKANLISGSPQKGLDVWLAIW